MLEVVKKVAEAAAALTAGADKISTSRTAFQNPDVIRLIRKIKATVSAS